MATCLISITGTSGKARVDYKIGSNSYSITSTIGGFYLEDTATDITYSTIEGDAVASSLCFTITELDYTCYTILWKKIIANGYKFDAVILGDQIIPITEVIFNSSPELLTNSINSSGDERVKIVDYTISTTNPLDSASSTYTYVFSVLSNNIPILRAKNSDSTGFIYFHGEPSPCTLSAL